MPETSMNLADAATSGSTPDWAAQTEEILCPLCEYNLRGLTEARCPECGHTFEWNKLLDPTQRVHPWLFEHHPSRNVWSWFRTMLGTILPRRFWTSLHPAQPSRPKRLILYWLVGVFILIVPVAANYIRAARQYYESNQSGRTSWAQWTAKDPGLRADILRNHSSMQAYYDEAFPLPPRWDFFRRVWRFDASVGGVGTAVMAFATWPLLAALTLMIFRISMQQARIGFEHVLRCTIYSGDIGIALAAGLLISSVMLVDELFFMGALPLPPDILWQALLAMVWIIVSWRLIQAYRNYLRFAHAVGVVLSVQLILFLLLMNFLLWDRGFYALRQFFLLR